ncbi:hypothetical protein Tco_1478513 [Tanacetum coccineum]
MEKRIEEDKVFDINNDVVVSANISNAPVKGSGNDKGSLLEQFLKSREASKDKYHSLSDSDDSEVEEVCITGLIPGGGFLDGLEADLDGYDGYEAPVYDLNEQEQAFCDQYDIRLNSRHRNHAMFSVVSKLKLLKKPLQKLKLAQGGLAKRVTDTRLELERVQTLMVNDSHNSVLMEKEIACLKAYKVAMKDEESMLKQRAKVEWLSEGDSNTKFFHKTVKGNLNRNRIESVEDMNGAVFFGDQVGDQFVKYFQSVLGDSRMVEPIVNPDTLFCKILSLEDSEFMVRMVTNEEIKAVIFAMNDDKASGPDGFSSKFFKTSWPIIGNEVCVAIRDFF